MKRTPVMIMLAVAILVCSPISVSAVMGALDDVPSQDVVMPFICEIGGGLDTLWAVAETRNTKASGSLRVYGWESSNNIYGKSVSWTAMDVVSNNACNLVSRMSTSASNRLKKDIDGDQIDDYYIGYVIYKNNKQVDQFVGWWYLSDLAKGFIAGATAYQAEQGVDPESLGENANNSAVFDPQDLTNTYTVGDNLFDDASVWREYIDNGPSAITARSMFPRYFIFNDDPESWTWWIMLSGNESNGFRCSICNEEEDCLSSGFSTEEFGVFDVTRILPAALHANFPKAGYARCTFDNSESYVERVDDNRDGRLDSIVITRRNSIMGWAYQRASRESLEGSWSVLQNIHMDRLTHFGLPQPAEEVTD
jgi:hypothetical protein